MLGFIEQILKAKLAVERGDAPQVTISLDLNDPKAQRLATLAKKLLLPTTKIHKSGLVTKTGAVLPGRAEEFIETLAKEVGDDVMRDLLLDLRAQQEAQGVATAKKVKKSLVSDAQAVAAVTKGMLTDEQLRRSFHGHEREAFGNIADALERGEAKL